MVRRLGLPFRDVDWTDWDELLRRVHRPAHEVTVALVGKYVDLPDAYLSVTEALRAGGFACDARVNIRWVASDECATPEGAAAQLSDVDGVCVPGGFGVRGIEGKLGALTYAREHRIPTLGLCLGLQCMVIEHARNLAGLDGANSAEFDPETPHPVIATMADQRDIVAGERDMGGTMRLGLYPAVLAEGSLVREVYGQAYVDERHRHRYEVNNSYREHLEATGLVFSGTSPDGRLVEYVELPREVHPYYVGTQAHPELRSRPTRAHPLFSGLVPGGTGPLGRTTRWSCPTRCRPVDHRRPPGRLPGRDQRPRLPGPRLGRRHRHRAAARRRAGASATSCCTPPRSRCSRSTTEDRVLVVHQYRHPARATLWELPAGLLDVAGEDPLAAASRELWEETHHEADRWDVLVDFMSSPGLCDEAIRVYLARELAARQVRSARGTARRRHAGGVGRPRATWSPRSRVGLHNPTLVVRRARRGRAPGPVDWPTLRPSDAPWPARGPCARSAEPDRRLLHTVVGTSLAV